MQTRSLPSYIKDNGWEVWFIYLARFGDSQYSIEVKNELVNVLEGKRKHLKEKLLGNINCIWCVLCKLAKSNHFWYLHWKFLEENNKSQQTNSQVLVSSSTWPCWCGHRGAGRRSVLPFQCPWRWSLGEASAPMTSNRKWTLRGWWCQPSWRGFDGPVCIWKLRNKKKTNLFNY